MFQVIKKTSFIWAFFLLATLMLVCFKPQDDTLNLIEDATYPRWIVDTKTDEATDQTSGISFIGRDSQKRRTFLLADDIGQISHLYINSDESFSVSHIKFSDTVEKFLQTLPKRDFEELIYDKFENRIYLSIEGNLPKVTETVGIYEVKFKNNDVFSNEITEITKIKITPEEQFLQYVDKNIGYEGVAVDDKYLYLGLEGFEKGKLFADSTYLYVVDKNKHNIIKRISTKTLGIGTICGLTSVNSRELYGIDRNAGMAFKLKLDEKLNVESIYKKSLEYKIPGYPNQKYVCALESVALDDKGYIYFVDDPWKTFYIPPAIIFNKLDKKTQDYFKRYIPIIYRFKMK